MQVGADINSIKLVLDCSEYFQSGHSLFDHFFTRGGFRYEVFDARLDPKEGKVNLVLGSPRPAGKEVKASYSIENQLQLPCSTLER